MAHRACKGRQSVFDMILWTPLACSIIFVAGERPELHSVPPIVPFNRAPASGSTQRRDMLEEIEFHDQEGFDDERQRANAEIHKLRSDTKDLTSREDDEYELPAQEEEGVDSVGNWNFKTARDSKVIDAELRNFSAHPHVEPDADFHGPWFSAARSQKQEIEFGVRRLKNATRFMSWQAEEAYRRIHNLNGVVAGYENKNGVKKGFAEALKTSDAWVDRIAEKMPEDIGKVRGLSESYLNIPVFGDDPQIDADRGVFKPSLKPKDEVTLTDKNTDDTVRFYRRSVGGVCQLHKDVTEPPPPKGHGQLFTSICGTARDEHQTKKIESLTWDIPDFQQTVKTTDDCGGEHEFVVEPKTEENVMSLVGMGQNCGVVNTGSVPSEYNDIFDDKGTVKDQVKKATPYKYYEYLLDHGPKREELSHRLELPPEVSQIPDY